MQICRTVVFVFVQLAKPLVIHSLLVWWRQSIVIGNRVQEPQQLMDTFTDLEELNLFLIQSSQADADEATSCEGWWGRIHKFGWVFTHMIRWDAIVGGDQTMQMYGKFEGFPWIPPQKCALFGLGVMFHDPRLLLRPKLCC